MKLRAIILGCGSSQGVPRLGGPDGRGDWGACDPANPKNRRTRCSIVVQRADDKHGWDADALTTVLIDTSPDLRQQFLANHLPRVDTVLYSHDHADQCHGIDDLRALALTERKRIPVYISETTAPDLCNRFAYCFNDNPHTGYPAILDAKSMPEPNKWFEVEGPSGPIPIVCFLQEHGPIQSLGFRFGRSNGLSYSPDVSDLGPEALEIVRGSSAWIVDALRYKPHPTHAHVERSLEWLAAAKVKRGILTNLHIDLDYGELDRTTPTHVSPAFDGMVIEVDAD